MRETERTFKADHRITSKTNKPETHLREAKMLQPNISNKSCIGRTLAFDVQASKIANQTIGIETASVARVIV